MTAHNFLVSIWNAFILTGIIYLIEGRGWSVYTLGWVFVMCGSWRISK